MIKNTKTYISSCFAILFMWICLNYGCASPKMVEGGPRDSISPKILKMIPENLTTNFKSKKIVIDFDEYFKLNDQFKEFSVTPDMERLPQLKIKKRSLEIEFLDSLESNTTYTLNFGKSIADINEGNAIKNFSYVFATGSQLDSLSISGKVLNAITGLPEFEALAFIIPLSRDTIFGKKKPSIYALTDSSGNFKLNNLKKDTYRIYALKEQGGDKIYNQNTDEIAFMKDSMVLNSNINNVNLTIFKEDNSVFRVNDRKLNTDGSIFMSFNQKLKKPKITITESALDATKKIKFNKTNDSVRVWLTDLSFDSTKVNITEDGKLLQTVKFTRGKKDTYTRNVTPTDNIEGNLLDPNRTLKLTFPLPLESIDISKITLLEDSTARSNFTITKDSIDFLSCYITYPWISKRKYELTFAAEAFTSIFNAKNKEFKKNFELANKDDYGTLKVKITTPEPNKSYILQVLNGQKNAINNLIINRDTTVSFSNYRAGKYFIRIIYDNNKNGIWDTGNVKEKRQPEHIYNEPKELSIRANWDRNETITIPKE